jgi:hypothetical protein
MLSLRHSLSRNLKVSTRAVSYAQQWATISPEEIAAKASGDYTKVSQVHDWENYSSGHKPYEGMGPLPPVNTTVPVEAQLRFGFMPEAWFKILEPRLGYSGGYTLFWGLMAALSSKEYIMASSPEVTWLFWAAVVIPPVMHMGLFPYLERESMIEEMAHVDRINKWKDYKMSIAESEVDGIQRLKEQASGLELAQQQRKNNLAMALDAEYRNRKADLTAAVKQRLDYHVAIKNAEREAESKHMVQWIENEVLAAIGKRDGKSDLNSAISQLKSMAK